MALAFTGPSRMAALAAWVLMSVLFVPTLRAYRVSHLWSVALPVIALFYMAATLASAIRHHKGARRRAVDAHLSALRSTLSASRRNVAMRPAKVNRNHLHKLTVLPNVALRLPVT